MGRQSWKRVIYTVVVRYSRIMNNRVHLDSLANMIELRIADTGSGDDDHLMLLRWVMVDAQMKKARGIIPRAARKVPDSAVRYTRERHQPRPVSRVA